MVGYQTCDAERWRAAFADDGRYFDFSTPPEGIAAEELSRHIRRLKKAMPDSGFDVFTAFVSADAKYAVIEYTWRGTFQADVSHATGGSHGGSAGSAKPKLVGGKPIHVTGVDIVEFNQAGKIARVVGYLDQHAFLTQMEALPSSL